MLSNRVMTAGALAAASVLALAGCASAAPGGAGDDTRISIVASTSVYGQLAEEIGGDLVAVTSIVTSAAQDPHSFEPSAQDQLTIANADLVIENGGGYDAFIDSLIDASGSEAPVITAVELSPAWPGESAGESDEAHDHPHVEGFNEHVWYDPHTMEHVAEAIAAELAGLSPGDGETFAANAAAFVEGIAGLEAQLGEIEASHAGDPVFVTEPVPLYLVAAAGLANVTPDEFSEAVEEGQDVAPAILLDALTLLRDGEVRVVIENAQTGGAETTQIVREAESRGIPVIAFSETLPEGQTYLLWMSANIEALAGALAT